MIQSLIEYTGLLPSMRLAAGDKLGPYEILAPIGAGGMGEVWKALDPRLNRFVAIKILKGGHNSRFQQEARAIAALNHPHICTLHDVGPNYLVMEFLDGAPVKGPMPLEDTLRIGVQIANALAAAHKRGILHRDLKPANILVTESGAKLLDFGLAKTTAGSGDEAAATKTVDGTIVGTAAYMSPEQAQGRIADERSEVFSFGSVLYEMLSGRRAFAGDSMIDVLSSVIRDNPPPLTSASGLRSIVERCLRKNPAERFQNMHEVTAALEHSAVANPPESQPSIAVLPFANLSGDKENEYFSDGLSEDILNALSQIEGLKVAARASSFSFKGKGAEMPEIGAKLRVLHVLDGSVRRSGNRVRVTVQLVDTTNGYQLWSDRYDRQMEDIFEVQDEIARAIADKLKVTIGAAVKQSTKNTEAYDLYLKGRHFWHQRSPGTMRLAIEAFEEAIRLDREYALAYAGLADCHGIFRIYGWVRKEEAQPKAHAAVTQAMNLNASLWEVQFSRGLYTLFFEHNWREAEPYLARAIEINPASSLAQVYYGVFLAMSGRREVALAKLRVASRLDPLSTFIHVFQSCSHFFLGDFEASERAAGHALNLQPGSLFPAWMRGLALCRLGRNAEAINLLEQVLEVSRAPIFLGFLGIAYGRAGRSEDAQRLLRELDDRASRGEYVTPIARIYIHIGLNDLPAMRRTLGEAVEDLTVLFLCVAIQFFPEEVRNDPEIHRLLLQI